MFDLRAKINMKEFVLRKFYIFKKVITKRKKQYLMYPLDVFFSGIIKLKLVSSV